jgi:hypothetical protein
VAFVFVKFFYPQGFRLTTYFYSFDILCFNLGKLTFKTTSFGKVFSRTSSVIFLIYVLSIQNQHSNRSLKENPIAGMPSIPASTAALMVPE